MTPIAKDIKRAFLCYPPIGLYQRGEERCQADIEGSATQAPHAPNDLGYLAAALSRLGIESLIRDYPAQRTNQALVFDEIISRSPDAIIISATNSTLLKDIEFLGKIKSLLPEVITIAKGSCFYSLSEEEFKKDVYKPLDIAIYGEAEFIITDLTNSLRQGCGLDSVKGIIHGIGTGAATKTALPDFREDLDTLAFPRRDLIRNELYKNPVNDRPMATIVISRGCPAQCIFCLTPLISGRKLRKRSVENVIAELKDCVINYGIKDFFFRADTFTMDKAYVRELCAAIRDNSLNISWVANSRTDAIDKELVEIMRQAGCWLMAFGIESGNDEIQRKIKKGTNAEQAREAIRLCKEAGIKTLGFFMIGFPWDSEASVGDTSNLIKELDCDFIEVHIAMPFEGTPLNTICKELGLIKESPLGYNYFSNPYGAGTLHLKRERLVKIRKDMIRRHYLRPSYVYRTLRACRSAREFSNYAKYGLRLAANILRSCKEL
ncbi:MAG: radical SAM protein [Candidatus Omnitrophota bacterium]